jgi:hypothetical protein
LVFIISNTKSHTMKKVLMLAAAAFMFSGIAFANTDKGKKKKCAKAKSCCNKEAKSSCNKDKKEATAEFKGEPKN